MNKGAVNIPTLTENLIIVITKKLCDGLTQQNFSFNSK